VELGHFSTKKSLAFAYELTGQSDMALRDFEKAGELDPKACV